MRQYQPPQPNDRSSGRAWTNGSWLDYSFPSGSRNKPPRSRSGNDAGGDKPRLGWLVFFALFALVCYNVGPIVEEIHYAWQRGKLRAESEDATQRLAQMSRSGNTDTNMTFPLVVKRVRPSVVQIDTMQERVVPPNKKSPFPQPRRMRTTGQGAGVVVHKSGYILTNYHVIRQATAVRVRLTDGSRYEQVQTVGVDPQTDLALLKIDAEDLIAAQWGDSNELDDGQWVLAMGNPFGLDRSVTAGIVSAQHRRNIVQSREMTYEDFLQTDAAVNPGNSGGPLVNMYGEVIGITTAIVGESFQGVGFAIPSEIAQDVFKRLKATGKVVRGWLGVGLENVTRETARRLDVPREGVRISRVVGGPAQRAGLRVDDVIIAWNGEEVSDYMQLSLKVAGTPIDTQAAVTFRRGEDEQTVKVTVGKRVFAE